MMEKYNALQKPGRLSRLLLLVVAAMSLVLPCCNREKRHELLTFVFDGVPPLDDPNASAADASGHEFATGPRPSKHEPTSQCHVCHGRDTEREYTRETKVIASVPDLCFGCHEDDRYNVSMHGPVLTGECLFCHKPHNSKFPSLLKKWIPDLCLNCHAEKDMVHIPRHDEQAYSNCLKCHEAHSSSRKKLLKPGVRETEEGSTGSELPNQADQE